MTFQDRYKAKNDINKISYLIRELLRKRKIKDYHIMTFEEYLELKDEVIENEIYG